MEIPQAGLDLLKDLMSKQLYEKEYNSLSPEKKDVVDKFAIEFQEATSEKYSAEAETRADAFINRFKAERAKGCL